MYPCHISYLHHSINVSMYLILNLLKYMPVTGVEYEIKCVCH